MEDCREQSTNGDLEGESGGGGGGGERRDNLILHSLSLFEFAIVV